jgi:hypothetical protein
VRSPTQFYKEIFLPVRTVSHPFHSQFEAPVTAAVTCGSLYAPSRTATRDGQTTQFPPGRPSTARRPLSAAVGRCRPQSLTHSHLWWAPRIPHNKKHSRTIKNIFFRRNKWNTKRGGVEDEGTMATRLNTVTEGWTNQNLCVANVLCGTSALCYWVRSGYGHPLSWCVAFVVCTRSPSRQATSVALHSLSNSLLCNFPITWCYEVRVTENRC